MTCQKHIIIPVECFVVRQRTKNFIHSITSHGSGQPVTGADPESSHSLVRIYLGITFAPELINLGADTVAIVHTASNLFHSAESTVQPTFQGCQIVQTGRGKHSSHHLLLRNLVTGGFKCLLVQSSKVQHRLFHGKGGTQDFNRILAERIPFHLSNVRIGSVGEGENQCNAYYSDRCGKSNQNGTCLFG